MNQPTSIQMLDAAIWQELGGEKAHDAEAIYHRSARFFPDGCSLARNIPKWRRSNFLQRFGPMLPSRNVSCNRASEELLGVSTRNGPLLAEVTFKRLPGFGEKRYGNLRFPSRKIG